MHFHLPRRHRRRLLLPPGLLALAGLLLLGCLALRPWQERLTRRSVLQLTMPVPPRPANSRPVGNPAIRWYLPTVAEATVMRPWHTAYFTGRTNNDVSEQRRIAAMTHAILIDSLNSNGIRVRFAQKARYEQLVFLLNLMEKEGFRKYWIDFYHSPITFYALTDAYKPITEFNSRILCGGVITFPPPPPPLKPFWVRFDDWITEFWSFHWLLPLERPEWRAPLVLLALLFLLSFRRLMWP